MPIWNPAITALFPSVPISDHVHASISRCCISLGGDCDRCSGEHAFFFRRRQKDLSMIVNTISTLRSKHIQHICHLPRITIYFFPPLVFFLLAFTRTSLNGQSDIYFFYGFIYKSVFLRLFINAIFMVAI